jgi:hypothetical protein
VRPTAITLAFVGALSTACSNSSSARGPGDASEGGDSGSQFSEPDGSVADASESPTDATVTAPDGGPSRDGSAEGSDGGSAIPPFVDPFDGAVGCPDGGYPVGSAPCTLELLLEGSTSLGNALNPGFCTNENGSRSVLGFSSVDAVSYGQGYDVNLNFATPISQGLVGQQSGVTVQIVQNNGIGNNSTNWSTPTGACAVDLTSDVCWFSEGVEYYLVSGTGRCSAPAAEEPADAGEPLTIGNFWFDTIIYP